MLVIVNRKSEISKKKFKKTLDKLKYIDYNSITI